MGAGEVTRLLGQAREGDVEAANALFEAVYSELHGLAGVIFRSQRAEHTLQPTAIVHEAYIKMVNPDGAPEWKDRIHFRRVAAQAMRQILINHAR
ncbi:MAG: ECF-type sigma factor, partial [Planctomycetota bacterium]